MNMRKGFTLIELLVVVAISVILFSILTAPVRAYDKVREADHNSCQCLNNMKQLALAMNSYAQDYDEKYPTSTRAPFVRDYVKDDQVFICYAKPFGYAYDNALTGKCLDKIEYPRETISLWEFDGGTNTVATMRHDNRASMVGFLDGHVKTMLADDVFLHHDCYGHDVVKPGANTYLKKVKCVVPLGGFAK